MLATYGVGSNKRQLLAGTKLRSDEQEDYKRQQHGRQYVLGNQRCPRRRNSRRHTCQTVEETVKVQ